MMAQRDYYEILGVPKTATPEDLKQAFRNLARKYHPDVSKEEHAEERFKEINEAYAVLSDEQKRAAYDRFGHAGVNGMGGAPGGYNTVDLSDIFGDLFSDFFGGGGSRGGRRTRNMPRRGDDLQYPVQLTFEESVFGIEKEIAITRDETCHTCHGNRAEPGTSPVRCTTCGGSGEVRQTRQSIFGAMVQVTTCPACRGTGETIPTPCRTCNGRGLERKIIRKLVNIPAGVDAGNQMRISGEGQPGVNGGPAGDLYLVIDVKPHKYFRRRNNDIMLDLNINIAQATLGSEITVPTVDGDEKLMIPAGTQPGKVITMRGKGVPSVRGTGRGDQHVVVNVEVPTRLNADQRKLFEELAKSLGTEVRPQERGFFDKIKEVLGVD
ncbi:MAG: molecular chaperone DnaJ [Anaerolineales bacterium]|nr:molecular chaperone DnaJ [Anaerolineales bacterium]